MVTTGTLAEAEASALRRLAAARARLHEDAALAAVAPGVFVGSVGAARDLAALKAAGVTHVLNASPAVPCFHGDALVYQRVPIYDDPDEDLGSHLPSALAFIRGAVDGGGAVLVHCYAGRSRSAALAAAHLLAGGAAPCLGTALDVVAAGPPRRRPQRRLCRPAGGLGGPPGYRRWWWRGGAARSRVPTRARAVRRRPPPPGPPAVPAAPAPPPGRRVRGMGGGRWAGGPCWWR